MSSNPVAAFLVSMRTLLGPAPAAKVNETPNAIAKDAAPLPRAGEPEHKTQTNSEGAAGAATPDAKTDEQSQGPGGSADTQAQTSEETLIMADANTNTSATVKAPTAATAAELKQNFPGDRYMAFREECAVKGLTILEAKGALGEKLQAERDEADKATADKAKKDAALGGAGVSTNRAASAPGEMGGQTTERKFTRSELIDRGTGRIGKVPGVTDYAQAVRAYEGCGLRDGDGHGNKLAAGDAEYLAQVNHRDLWLDEREKRGEQHMAVHGESEKKRAAAIARGR